MGESKHSRQAKELIVFLPKKAMAVAYRVTGRHLTTNRARKTMPVSHADKCAAAAVEINQKLNSIAIPRYWGVTDLRQYQIVPRERPKYRVTIPKGGCFYVEMYELNLWQRTWLRFIGWEVSTNISGNSKS